MTDRAAVADSLEEAGFGIEDVRDAPDRPGLELVFIASRSSQGASTARPDRRRPGHPRRWRPGAYSQVASDFR